MRTRRWRLRISATFVSSSIGAYLWAEGSRRALDSVVLLLAFPRADVFVGVAQGP